MLSSILRVWRTTLREKKKAKCGKFYRFYVSFTTVRILGSQNVSLTIHISFGIYLLFSFRNLPIFFMRFCAQSAFLSIQNFITNLNKMVI